MYSNPTNTVYVDGKPRHFGKDVQALMSLVRALYVSRNSELTLFCHPIPESNGRAVWMRYDRQTDMWEEVQK
jgi:hypothetical protein